MTVHVVWTNVQTTCDRYILSFTSVYMTAFRQTSVSERCHVYASTSHLELTRVPEKLTSTSPTAEHTVACIPAPQRACYCLYRHMRIHVDRYTIVYTVILRVRVVVVTATQREVTRLKQTLYSMVQSLHTVTVHTCVEKQK